MGNVFPPGPEKLIESFIGLLTKSIIHDQKERFFFIYRLIGPDFLQIYNLNRNICSRDIFYWMQAIFYGVIMDRPSQMTIFLHTQYFCHFLHGGFLRKGTCQSLFGIEAIHNAMHISANQVNRTID